MSKYSNSEKDIIAIESDLLANSLTLEEKKEKNMGLINSKITNKINKLLSQQLKLSLELEKLSQRGTKILFDINNINSDVVKKFVLELKLLFTIGEEKLLYEKTARIVTSYAEFEKASFPLVYIADKPMDALLRNQEIREKLLNKQLVLVSDNYKKPASLKEECVSGKKVFISGSRTQKEIPLSVQRTLESIKKQEIEILIGDSAKGIDAAVINYLKKEPKYPYVNIYTIKAKPRVKVEQDWEIRIVQPPQTLSAQQKQMMKDRKMADLADWGLVVFNPIFKNQYGAIQVSAGTLRNAIQLLLNNKAVKFFFMINGEIKSTKLKTIDQLQQVLNLYKRENLSETEKKEILSAKGVGVNDDPCAIKFSKITKKFEELLKNEQQELASNKLKKTEQTKNRVNQLSINFSIYQKN